MVKNKSKLLSRVLIYFILILFFLWTIMPVYLIVTNSFKENLEIRSIPPTFFFKPTISQYKQAFMYGEFGKYFKNSFIIASSTTLISVLGGALGAYGLMITKSRWASFISNYLLIGKLVPVITILIPFYIILHTVNLTGTYVGPILAHSSINLPFVLWLMLSFAKDLPKEIIESATIDGAGRMQIFWKIVFPMILPAIGAAVILVMQFSWNELLFSLQLTSIESYTLPVGIARFVGAIAVDWGRSSAAASITMIPIIILSFFMQRFMISGLTAGAVKE